MAAAAAARDRQTALALRLAKHLAPGGADDDAAADNVAFSPLSVHAALALVATGATLAQLLAFLGAPTAKALAAFGRRVAERVLADRSDSGGPRVLFGGGVWVDASRGRLTDAFRDVAAKSYKSDARTVSFTKKVRAWLKVGGQLAMPQVEGLACAPSSTGMVWRHAHGGDARMSRSQQGWGCSDRTGRRRRGCDGSGDPAPMGIRWKKKGNKSTARGVFHRLDGSLPEAEFMTGIRWLDVACMDGFKVLKLPYEPGFRA
ncbi:hypothetical protein EJB05_27487, partial [Eragrostis curvula]